MDRAVAIRYWHVPAAQVPRDPAAITPWLNDWWERVDGWVGAQLDDAAQAALTPEPIGHETPVPPSPQ